MGLFFKSEEQQLKDIIRGIVRRAIPTSHYFLEIESHGLEIVLHYYWKGVRDHSCVRNSNGDILFSSSGRDGGKFIEKLCLIAYSNEQKKEEKERQQKEKEEELKHKILISKELARLSQVGLDKISEKVREEFNPVFRDAKRIQEITEELEQIHSRYK